METEASIAALRDALRADERVATAILFGSAAKGMARRASDLDVALIARSAADARSPVQSADRAAASRFLR